MAFLKPLLRDLINLVDRHLGLREFMQEGTPKIHPLAGDRAIEWSWVTVHLPTEPCHVLDLGCVGSALTGIASRMGHHVTAVDLNDIEYEMPNVTFCKGDINEVDIADPRFDVIMNCSMIEHVGLEGRYGSGARPDGDIMAMNNLSGLLTPAGKMILTIPVGIDAVFHPFHRVYGTHRLSQLLANYEVLEEEFWTRTGAAPWSQCSMDVALSTQGSPTCYALGLFVLGRRN